MGNLTAATHTAQLAAAVMASSAVLLLCRALRNTVQHTTTLLRMPVKNLAMAANDLQTAGQMKQRHRLVIQAEIADSHATGDFQIDAEFEIASGRD